MTARVVTALGAVGIAVVACVAGIGFSGLAGVVIPDPDTANVVALLGGVLIGSTGAATIVAWLRHRHRAR